MITKQPFTNRHIVKSYHDRGKIEDKLEKDREELEICQREIAIIHDRIFESEKLLRVLDTVKYIVEEDDQPIAITSLGLNPDKCETIKATDSSMTRYGMVFKSQSTNEWTGRLSDSANKLYEFHLENRFTNRDAIEVAILDWIIDGRTPDEKLED